MPALTSAARPMTLPRDLLLLESPSVGREAQAQAAAVDVERVAEETPAHRGALDVPAGPAGTPRRGPLCVGGLVGLGALPQREVLRRTLAAQGRGGRRLHVLGPLAGERAVVRVRTHVEVHVAAAVRRRVGVPL